MAKREAAGPGPSRFRSVPWALVSPPRRMPRSSDPTMGPVSMVSSYDIASEVERAHGRIRAGVLRTPALRSRPLGRRTGAEVHLKLESEQVTGSFKARGALNKVLSLTPEERARGVVTASTGNHAQGVARALELTGVEGTIWLPENAASSKVEALREYGVPLDFHGRDCLETETHAKRVAGEEGAVWISPYDDPRVIGGQGTAGLELAEQVERIDAVFVPVGGGGLVSGVAGWLKHVDPSVTVVGCQPEASPEMARSVEAGRIVEPEGSSETLSDGTAGGVEQGSVTFEICRELVDEWALLPEPAIAGAMRFMVERHHKLVEGAGALPVAAVLERGEELAGESVALVVSGGNVSAETLEAIL